MSPLPEREWMREAIATGAANAHPGKEPSEPPIPTGDSLEPTSRSSLLEVAAKADKRAEKATKIAASLKTWGSIAAAFFVGLGTAYGWAHEKASKADVAAVGASDRAAHEQISHEQAAQNERTAAVEAGQKILLEQSTQILSMVRNINAKDEKRGTPTRLPIKDLQ
jgi:hypothetical protein